VSIRIETGDCLEVLRTLPAASVQCCVTSPPYFGLRDYGHGGQIGLEPTPDEYVAKLTNVFRWVRRALVDDGTLWLNLGDSYASNGNGSSPSATSKLGSKYRDGCPYVETRVPEGLKQKDMMGIPWRVAFALQADGWYLRSDIIWHKPNSMPESVTDRPTRAHEYLFLLAKSRRYYYDAAAISEPVTGHRAEDGLRNRRSVWTVTTQQFSGAHFATFPPDLIEPCIKAGCPVGGTVLDPFGGAGTTGLVADRLQRNALLIELNPEYAEMARNRIINDAPLFAGYSY
jgi:DNA modification methylase